MEITCINSAVIPKMCHRRKYFHLNHLYHKLTNVIDGGLPLWLTYSRFLGGDISGSS